MTEPTMSLTKSIRLAIPNVDGDGIAEWIHVEVPVTIDPDTGEEIVTGDGLKMLDEAKARHMGLLLPDQFKSLRERFGMTQKQIGELLQIGEKTWTRWETGRGRPSRSLNVLIKAIFDGILPLSYLEALSSGVSYTQIVAANIKQLAVSLARTNLSFCESQPGTAFICHLPAPLGKTQSVFGGWSFVSTEALNTAYSSPWETQIGITGELEPRVEEARTLYYRRSRAENWREETKLTKFG